MNIEIVKHIVEIAKSIGSTSNKLIESTDSGKYVNDVKALSKSVDETYAKMRELISQDENLSVTEKLEKLEKLAQSQLAAQQACEKSIQENREHLTKIAGEILAALATCGISCIPRAIRKRKKSIAIVTDTTEYSELSSDETGELNPSIIEEGVTH